MTTVEIIAPSAGKSLFSRLARNFEGLNVPNSEISFAIISLITNPEMTKKTSTPRNPPVNAT
jgi:hypothetical protein